MHVTANKGAARSEARAITVRRSRRTTASPVNADKDISPEKKAEIEKAAKAVADLAQAVQAKQKELMEAQTKLSKLTGRGDIAGRVRQDMPPRTARALDLVERRVMMQRDAEAGEKRIEALEKKLEKLLEEVAALKKDRGEVKVGPGCSVGLRTPPARSARAGGA